jgi:uroporphyrinogen-III synthase
VDSEARRLQGVRVLVTRPAHQADNLCRMIEAEGGTALRLPLLSIEPATNPGALQSRFAAGHDCWIFTSANAVRHASPLMAGHAPRRIYAVGAATGAALAAAGFEQVLAPEAGASSEALLAIAELQAVQGQRALIVTGEGGRGLLEEQLAERGAQVERADVYRRVPLPYPPEAVASAVRRSDVIVITSGEALDHLLRLVPENAKRTLLRRPLVVPAARVVEKARAWGFLHPPRLAEPMSDAAVCAACAQPAAEGVA